MATTSGSADDTSVGDKEATALDHSDHGSVKEKESVGSAQHSNVETRKESGNFSESTFGYQTAYQTYVKSINSDKGLRYKIRRRRIKRTEKRKACFSRHNSVKDNCETNETVLQKEKNDDEVTINSKGKCSEDPAAHKETADNKGTVTSEAEWWSECKTSGEVQDSVSFDFCPQYVSQVDMTDDRGILNFGPLIGRGFECLDLFNGKDNLTIDTFQSEPDLCLNPVTGELETPAVLNIVLLFKKIIQLTMYLACKIRVCEMTQTAFVHGGGRASLSSVNILNLKHDILTSTELNLNKLAENIHKLQLRMRQGITKVGVFKIKKRMLFKLQCVLFDDLFYTNWDVVNLTSTQREIFNTLHDHTEFALNQTRKEACEIRNGFFKDVIQKLSTEKDKDIQYQAILMREAKRQSAVNKMEQDIAESNLRKLQEEPNTKYQKLRPTRKIRTGKKMMKLPEEPSDGNARSLHKRWILPKTVSDGNTKSNEEELRILPQMSSGGNKRKLPGKLNNTALGLSPQKSRGGKKKKLPGNLNKTALGLLLQISSDGKKRTLPEIVYSKEFRMPQMTPMLFGADKKKLTETLNNKELGISPQISSVGNKSNLAEQLNEKELGISPQMSTDVNKRKFPEEPSLGNERKLPENLKMSSDENLRKFLEKKSFDSQKYIFDPAVQDLLIETGEQNKKRNDTSDSNTRCTPRNKAPTVICIPQDCKEHAMNLIMNVVNPFVKYRTITQPLKKIDYADHATITGLIASGQYAPVMKSIQTRYLQTIEVLRASKFDYKIWLTYNKEKQDPERYLAYRTKKIGDQQSKVNRAAVSIKMLSHVLDSQTEVLLDVQTETSQTRSKTDGFVDHFVGKLDRQITALNRIAFLTSCLSGQVGTSKRYLAPDSQNSEKVPKTNSNTESAAVHQGLNAPVTTLGQFDVHDTNTAFLVPCAVEGIKTATRKSPVYQFRTLRELFENAKKKPNVHQTSDNLESPNECVETLPKGSILIRDVKAFLESKAVSSNESIPKSPQIPLTVNQTVGTVGQVTRIIRVPPESVAIKHPIALLVTNKSPVGMPIPGTIIPMTIHSDSIDGEVDVKPSIESLARLTVSADNIKQPAKNPSCTTSNDDLLKSIKTEPVDEDNISINQPGDMLNQGNQNGTQLKPVGFAVNTADTKVPILKRVFSSVNNGNLRMQNINVPKEQHKQPLIAVPIGNNLANLVSNPSGATVSNTGFDGHIQPQTIVSRSVGYAVNKDGISLPFTAPACFATVNKDRTPAMPIETGLPVVQPIASPYMINVYLAQGVSSAPNASTSNMQLIQSKKYFGTQFVSNPATASVSKPATASVSIESQTHPIITNLKGSTVPNLTTPGDNILRTFSVQSEQVYTIAQANNAITQMIPDAATIMLTCKAPDDSVSEPLFAPGSVGNNCPASDISNKDQNQPTHKDRDQSFVAPDSIGKDSPESSLLYRAERYCRAIIKLMHNFIHGKCDPPEEETSCSPDTNNLSDSVLKIKEVFSLQAPSGSKGLTVPSSECEQTIQDRRNARSQVLPISMENRTSKLQEKILLDDGTELKVEISDDYVCCDQEQPTHKTFENDAPDFEKVVSQQPIVRKELDSQNPLEELHGMEQHGNQILKLSLEQENTNSNSQRFNPHGGFEMIKESIARVHTHFNENACVLFESFLDELSIEVKLSKNELDQIKYLFKQLKQKTIDEERSKDADEETGICKTVVKRYHFKSEMMSEIVYHILYVKIYPFDGFKRVWFTEGGEIFGYSPEHFELCTIIEDMHGTRLYICGICNLHFKIMENYLKHENNSHSKPLLYACSKCRLTFVTSQGLSNHECMENKEKDFFLTTEGGFSASQLCHACAYLKKNFKKVAEFLQYPRKTRFLFCCEICRCEMLYQSEFNQHMSKHKESTMIGYKLKQCKLCQKQCVRCCIYYDDQYCKCYQNVNLNDNVEKGIPTVHQKCNNETTDLLRRKFGGEQTSDAFIIDTRKQKVASGATSNAFITDTRKQKVASGATSNAFITDTHKQKVVCMPTSHAFITATRKQNVAITSTSHAFITDTRKQKVASIPTSDAFIIDTRKQKVSSETSDAYIIDSRKQKVASGISSDAFITNTRKQKISSETSDTYIIDTRKQQGTGILKNVFITDTCKQKFTSGTTSDAFITDTRKQKVACGTPSDAFIKGTRKQKVTSGTTSDAYIIDTRKQNVSRETHIDAFMKGTRRQGGYDAFLTYIRNEHALSDTQKQRLAVAPTDPIINNMHQYAKKIRNCYKEPFKSDPDLPFSARDVLMNPHRFREFTAVRVQLTRLGHQSKEQTPDSNTCDIITKNSLERKRKCLEEEAVIEMKKSRVTITALKGKDSWMPVKTPNVVLKLSSGNGPSDLTEGEVKENSTGFGGPSSSESGGHGVIPVPENIGLTSKESKSDGDNAKGVTEKTGLMNMEITQRKSEVDPFASSKDDGESGMDHFASLKDDGESEVDPFASSKDDGESSLCVGTVDSEHGHQDLVNKIGTAIRSDSGDDTDSADEIGDIYFDIDQSCDL